MHFMMYVVSDLSKIYPYPKEAAIVVMRSPKKSSSFLSPDLSSPRKVNVSTTVMRTPAHRGTKLLERRLMAMAVPITSCMSEPMMATSTMTQRARRGTLR